MQPQISQDIYCKSTIILTYALLREPCLAQRSKRQARNGEMGELEQSLSCRLYYRNGRALRSPVFNIPGGTVAHSLLLDR